LCVCVCCVCVCVCTGRGDGGEKDTSQNVQRQGRKSSPFLTPPSLSSNAVPSTGTRTHCSLSLSLSRWSAVISPVDAKTLFFPVVCNFLFRPLGRQRGSSSHPRATPSYPRPGPGSAKKRQTPRDYVIVLAPCPCGRSAAGPARARVFPTTSHRMPQSYLLKISI
jgi:hypothetical protein